MAQSGRAVGSPGDGPARREGAESGSVPSEEPTRDDRIAAAMRSYSGDILGDVADAMFVRSLVGMDRSAAKDAMQTFLAGKSLSANQIEFVNLVVGRSPYGARCCRPGSTL